MSDARGSTSHDLRPSDRELRELVESNPGQATLEEYRLLRDRIVANAPGNVLIFGVGRDSHLWIDANRRGRTVFLEDVPEWIEVARSHVPGIEVIRVSYSTRRFLWKWHVKRPEGRLTMKGLPDWIRRVGWRLVLVDAPQGQSWKRPGRMQSSWEASRLASGHGDPVDVLVHDCHREVEATCADRFLGDEAMVEQVGSLRWYRVGSAETTAGHP
jgi:hypothetical protein